MKFTKLWSLLKSPLAGGPACRPASLGGPLFQQFIPHRIHHQSRNGLRPYFLLHILADGFDGPRAEEYILGNFFGGFY